MAASKSHRCILMLDIQPSVMKWCSDLAMDFSGLQFHRKVDLADEAVGQTLVALRQELETPGVNGAFYVEVLFYLLLARLVRCASNLAEPASQYSPKVDCQTGGSSGQSSSWKQIWPGCLPWLRYLEPSDFIQRPFAGVSSSRWVCHRINTCLCIA